MQDGRSDLVVVLDGRTRTDTTEWDGAWSLLYFGFLITLPFVAGEFWAALTTAGAEMPLAADGVAVPSPLPLPGQATRCL